MSHCCLVNVAQLYSHVLGDAKQEMLTELQEMFLLKLFNFIGAFDFVSIAARFNGEAVWNLPVAEDPQSGAILFVFFVSKLAIIVLEVRREIVKDHWKALDYDIIVCFFVYWRIAED